MERKRGWKMFAFGWLPTEVYEKCLQAQHVQMRHNAQFDWESLHYRKLKRVVIVSTFKSCINCAKGCKIVKMPGFMTNIYLKNVSENGQKVAKSHSNFQNLHAKLFKVVKIPKNKMNCSLCDVLVLRSTRNLCIFIESGLRQHVQQIALQPEGKSSLIIKQLEENL